MIDEQRAELVGGYQSLKKSKKFKEFEAYVKLIVKQLNKVINTAGTDNKRIYTARDLAILQKGFIIKLTRLPQIKIDDLLANQELPVEEFDAFEDDDEFDDFSMDFNK